MTTRPNLTNPERNGSAFSSLLRRQIVTPKSWIYVWALALLFPAAVWCQTTGQPDPATTAPEQVTYGGYLIHQSFEAGYRVSDSTGNESMFDTLVNTHEGPRLFEQMLSMLVDSGVVKQENGQWVVKKAIMSAAANATNGHDLDRDAVEYERLIDTLTINVTKLFRNWSTFDAVARLVVPILWEGAARPHADEPWKIQGDDCTDAAGALHPNAIPGPGVRCLKPFLLFCRSEA